MRKKKYGELEYKGGNSLKKSERRGGREREEVKVRRGLKEE